MPVKRLNPYLTFDGKAEEAIALYRHALGAHTESFLRFGEMQGSNVPDEYRSRIVHAELRIGENLLMLNDAAPGRQLPGEGNMSVYVEFDGELELETRFEALAAGGRIDMPLQQTSWAERFGILTDRLGVRWMFHCSRQP